ncbi:hypothetical protein ACULML_17640 [Xanthomonas arboricola pv. corylina]|uniref:hypothetical protein n=1 Tax=Xanthomonas arboricola TaxID=56448 RepID=UPI004040794E
MNEPFGDSQQLAHPAAGVPDGWVSVPREPTAEIVAGAAMAAWPCASPADIEMARKAADIVLGTEFDLGPGMTKDLLAATIATMAPAYRAMLAAAPAAPMHQAAPVERQGARDALIDVTDPWRGLYRAERLRANGDGDLYHPDLPSRPDDREDALDKLVRAQGFDFQVVAGEFTEEAIEDGDELYWQEMRAWNPEAPEGDWRLAWKGDTEDGPYAWFVRPMALRPEPEAIAARQPVGVEPVAWQWRSRIKGGAWDAWENGRYDSEPAPFMDVEHRVRPAAQPAPAAVPVDVLDALVETWKERADFHDERALEADSIGDLQTAVAVHTARSTELRQVAHALKCATHPQPAAASWRPIGEAVAGKLYVVGWRDPGDTETPDRHEFDYMADGEFWANHDDAVQHAEAVAPAGSEMPPHEAPYQWLIEIPALPSAERLAKPAGEASSNNQPETTR